MKPKGKQQLKTTRERERALQGKWGEEEKKEKSRKGFDRNSFFFKLRRRRRRKRSKRVHTHTHT